MTLLTTAASEFAKRIAEKRDRESREALEATDWDTTPIVDLVWVRPSPRVYARPGGSSTEKRDVFAVDTPRLVVERYEHPPPPVEESGVTGRRCEVQRVTRPLYEKLRSEGVLDA